MSNSVGYSNYARVEITDKIKKDYLYYFGAWVKLEGTPTRGSQVFAAIGLENSGNPAYAGSKPIRHIKV